MKRALLAVLVGAFAAAAPAYAHHSFAADYLEDQRVAIEGDIVQFELRNPHSWVYVMTADENGEMQKYSAEWFSATRLQAQGVTQETIRPGDHVILNGAPGRKAAEHRLHLKSIERPADGWKWAGGRR